jgi:hypothetical protein
VINCTVLTAPRFVGGGGRGSETNTLNDTMKAGRFPRNISTSYFLF